MTHRWYYLDLNRQDFSSDEDYLLERVKRGMAAGYSLQQCFDQWLMDLAIALGCPETAQAGLEEEYHEYHKTLCSNGQKRKRETEEEVVGWSPGRTNTQGL